MKNAKLRMSNTKFRLIMVPILAILLVVILVVTTLMTTFSPVMDAALGRGTRHIANVSRRVGNEGFVLLKNADSAGKPLLPLSENSKVTPFGYRYLNPVYSVLGSGAVYNGMTDYGCSNAESKTMEEAIASNFDVNGTVVDRMKNAEVVLTVQAATHFFKNLIRLSTRVLRHPVRIQWGSSSLEETQAKAEIKKWTHMPTAHPMS